MLTKEQYEDALKIAQSYASVDPTPDSRYGQRLAEMLLQIEIYEAAHGEPIRRPASLARWERWQWGRA